MFLLTIGSEPSEHVGVEPSVQGGRLIISTYITEGDKCYQALSLSFVAPVLSSRVVVSLVSIGAIGKGEVVAEMASCPGCCQEAGNKYQLHICKISAKYLQNICKTYAKYLQQGE